MMLCEPIFEAAAAPDTDMAVARLNPCATASIFAVETYPVVSLPTKLRLNRKKSALRPRLFATFEF